MHHKHIVLERAQLGVADVPARELGLDDVGGPLSAYLLRPYLDLSEFVDGPSETTSVEVAFRQLAAPDAPRLMIQTHPGRGLRTALVRESGLPAYGITRARSCPSGCAPTGGGSSSSGRGPGCCRWASGCGSRRC